MRGVGCDFFKIVYLLFEKESSLEEKNLIPLVTKSFLVE